MKHIPSRIVLAPLIENSRLYRTRLKWPGRADPGRLDSGRLDPRPSWPAFLSAILAKLSVTWYTRVDWTPFIFLVCCPFVPPFSSVCCAIQQPLYCIFTLTTNLRRPLWVNKWFQSYLDLRNEQLELKQSQVKTYPSIQVSNSKLTHLWSTEEDFTISSARTDTYCVCFFFCNASVLCMRLSLNIHIKHFRNTFLFHIWARGNAFQCILRF